MEGFKYQVFRAALNTLYFSGAHTLLRPLIGGVGAILMLHHVRPRGATASAEPSARGDAEVLRARDPAAAPLQVDLISLDEMHRRLTTGISPAAASSA